MSVNDNSGEGTPENNNNQEQTNNQDPLLNFKSEVSRKLQNSESKMSELIKQNQVLAESLKTISSRLAPPPKQDTEEDLESLAYSNPKLYAQKVSDMAVERATKATTEVTERQNRTTQVLNSLYKDYPELGNTESELTQTAVNIYNSLSPSEKNSPSAYQLAVREAAAQLGVLPSHKRKSSDDDFVAPGSKGASGNRSSRSSKSEELDPMVLETSRLFGRDIKDPKVIERLKQHSKRSRWSRYE